MKQSELNSLIKELGDDLHTAKEHGCDHDDRRNMYKLFEKIRPYIVNQKVIYDPVSGSYIKMSDSDLDSKSISWKDLKEEARQLYDKAKEAPSEREELILASKSLMCTELANRIKS